MKTDIQTKKKLNVDLEEVDQTQRESPQRTKVPQLASQPTTTTVHIKMYVFKVLVMIEEKGDQMG